MILHCGGQHATFEDVALVEVPPATTTYRPVPHADLIRLLEDRVTKETGLIKPNKAFGLNKEGKQLFGTLTYDMGTTEGPVVDLSAFDNGLDIEQARSNYGFSIGFRNSYDKSMSLGIAVGATLFVCDNLALHGSWLTIMRKHTQNVWDDVVPMAMTRIASSVGGWVEMVRFMEGMKQRSVTTDEGYRHIGLGLGRGVLTANGAGVALKEWRHMARREEHPFHDHANTSFGLYQSFTEGLKLGRVTRKIDQYTGTSALFEEAQLVEPMTQELPKTSSPRRA